MVLCALTHMENTDVCGPYWHAGRPPTICSSPREILSLRPYCRQIFTFCLFICRQQYLLPQNHQSLATNSGAPLSQGSLTAVMAVSTTTSLWGQGVGFHPWEKSYSSTGVFKGQQVGRWVAQLWHRSTSPVHPSLPAIWTTASARPAHLLPKWSDPTRIMQEVCGKGISPESFYFPPLLSYHSNSIFSLICRFSCRAVLHTCMQGV